MHLLTHFLFIFYKREAFIDLISYKHLLTQVTISYSSN